MTPLVVEFQVSTDPHHAFDTWVSRPTMWWPRDHTISKGDMAEIVIERAVGGRIYERAADGREHDWGRIEGWDPPNRLAFTWHLFFDPSEATNVEVTFSPHHEETVVRIEQTGWGRLGNAAELRRTNTDKAWRTIAPHFAASAAQ